MYLSRETPTFEVLVAEQEQVLATIRDLSLWWAEAGTSESPPFDSLCCKVHDLRAALSAHFQHEEACELAALERGDAGATQEHLDRLVRTHALFLADLDLMTARLRGAQPGTEHESEVSRAFAGFLNRLKKHEDEQMQILRSVSESPTAV